MTAPTVKQIEAALDVLLWLHEHSSDGSDRDEISHVRYLLDNELVAHEARAPFLRRLPAGVEIVWPKEPS